MAYENCKIYFDGSHHVAIIPREQKRAFRSHAKPDEFAVVAGELDDRYIRTVDFDDAIPVDRITTRDDEFDRFFGGLAGCSDSTKQEALTTLMAPMFDSVEHAAGFVAGKLKNKRQARQARSTRFRRKAYLNTFTFYATFTYDDAKCSYIEFDRQLRVFLNNMACRHGWKVMMVPEWGKDNNRYHFHALVAIPKGAHIPGEFKRYRSYNKNRRRMVEVCENTYFAERWGRNDWQSLGNMPKSESDRAVSYIIKYLTKTDAPIYYSRGLPTFILSDIRGEDIIAQFWRDDKKAVLFDDWHCFYNDIDVGSYQDDYLDLLGCPG